MKVAIVTPFLETKGGLERIILKIAQHFHATIHCIRYAPEATFPGFAEIDVRVVPKTMLARLPFGKRVAGAMEAGNYFYNTRLEGYDLVIAFQAPSEWIRNRNAPVIWYCNSPNREAFDLYDWRMKRRGLISKLIFWFSIQAFRHFEYKTVPAIEHIFANSENVKKRIRKYLGRDSEVLYLGIDSARFSCKGYEKFFFYPSRLAPEKDIEYAINAFKIFSRNNPGWKFIIAGALSDRSEHVSYFRRLQSLCDSSISIETNLTEEQLHDLYSRCYTVLFTPINEDFGLVPLEGMASCKPCIAKNEGGPKETIADGKDGFLADSPEEMAGKMELLAKDEKLCKSMGEKGRKKVKKDFTWERFLKRFETVAKSLLQNNK